MCLPKLGPAMESSERAKHPAVVKGHPQCDLSTCPVLNHCQWHHMCILALGGLAPGRYEQAEEMVPLLFLSLTQKVHKGPKKGQCLIGVGEGSDPGWREGAFLKAVPAPLLIEDSGGVPIFVLSEPSSSSGPPLWSAAAQHEARSCRNASNALWKL
ncbi:hypothetical protein SRHO_G00336360 [Serrasalmus rhombeus]